MTFDEKCDYKSKNNINCFAEDLDDCIIRWQEKKKVIFKLQIPLLYKDLDYSEIPFHIRIQKKYGFKIIKVPCNRIIQIYEKIPKQYANNRDLDNNDPIVPTMDPYDIIVRWKNFDVDSLPEKKIKLMNIIDEKFDF